MDSSRRINEEFEKFTKRGMTPLDLESELCNDNRKFLFLSKNWIDLELTSI
jgi:hypothetical protein